EPVYDKAGNIVGTQETLITAMRYSSESAFTRDESGGHLANRVELFRLFLAVESVMGLINFDYWQVRKVTKFSLSILSLVGEYMGNNPCDYIASLPAAIKAFNTRFNGNFPTVIQNTDDGLKGLFSLAESAKEKTPAVPVKHS